MSILKKLILVLCLALAAPLAHAAPGGGNGRAARDEVREKIRALRIARVIEALDLDEQGAARLAPILDRAYDDIAAVAKDSGEARRELRVLVLAQPPDDARMNRLIDRLLANKQKIDALESGIIVQVRKVLTPAQVGRLVVVLPEINHQIQQQIRKAVRGGAPGQPGGGPEGDPF
jgi:Spy/CpxP family protein refolding chaperone